MPGVLSQPSVLVTHSGVFASGEMAPSPPHYAAVGMGRDEQWDSKLQQLAMSMPRLPRNHAMQGSSGWQEMDRNSQHGWQGQHMMPMQGGNDVQIMMNNSQNMQNPPVSQNNPNMRTMLNMQTSRPPQNMQSMPMMPRSQVAPDVLPNRMQNVNNMQNIMVMPCTQVSHDAPGRQNHILEPRGQSMPQMSDMRNQMMQFIAVPNGSLPPEGAIPMGPMGPPPQQLQDAPSPQMVQVIAVPVGEPPPEGAILIDQYSAPASLVNALPVPAKADPWQNLHEHELWQNSPRLEPWETPTKSESWSTNVDPQPRPTVIDSESWMTPSKAELPRPNKAFKIIDPKTRREVRSHEEEVASAPRRMRIVNPKTGEEVR